MENNITNLDSKDVLTSIKNFPTQCENAFKNIKSITPENREIRNIVVMGMGGSALGAHVLNGLKILKLPLIISNEYSIPLWVNEHTLLFAISYSGTTEETLSATKEALERGVMVVGITGGGALEKILLEHNRPVYLIDKKDNPCDQPRYGVGAMMLIMLRVCIDNNLSIVNKEEMQKAIEELGVWQKNFDERNLLKEIYETSKSLENKMPLLIYAEHLSGLGNFMRNQIHETGKALAQTHNIPELNHHLMEGLSFPKENVNKLVVIFFESDFYSEKIKKRIMVTKDVLEKQNIKYITVSPEGDSKLSQVLIAMLYGMYLAFSIAIIHGKDPSVVPWVDYFKEQLAK